MHVIVRANLCKVGVRIAASTHPFKVSKDFRRTVYGLTKAKIQICGVLQKK